MKKEKDLFAVKCMCTAVSAHLCIHSMWGFTRQVYDRYLHSDEITGVTTLLRFDDDDNNGD